MTTSAGFIEEVTGKHSQEGAAPHHRQGRGAGTTPTPWGQRRNWADLWESSTLSAEPGVVPGRGGPGGGVAHTRAGDSCGQHPQLCGAGAATSHPQRNVN